LLSDAIGTLDMLREHLHKHYAENHRDDPSDSTANEPSRFLCTSINNGLDHLEKYHALLTKTPVYLAAVALNPILKFDYFSLCQTPSQATKSKKAVRRLWETQYRLDSDPDLFGSAEKNTTDNLTLLETWYCGSMTAVAETSSAAAPTPPRPRATRTSQRSQPAPLDELDRWLLEPAEKPGTLSNVIAYWLAKRGKYPQLSHMALDILSIPPTSCEAERIFSR
jgi:hypothetical protein